MLNLVIMANHDLPLILRAKMHRPAKAVLEYLAISAGACFHPGAVAERLETVFPHIEEIVLVDIALYITTVDVGTGRDGAINQNGADGNARTAEIEPVTDFTLIRPDIGLTTELAVNPSLLSGGDDEVHELAELFIAEL